MSARDLAAMRQAASELLLYRARIVHYERTTDDWGHEARTSSETLELPCAIGERSAGAVSDPVAMQRATFSLLVPHDATVAIGDEVVDVLSPDGASLSMRGRVHRVTRTAVLALVDVGGA